MTDEEALRDLFAIQAMNGIISNFELLKGYMREDGFGYIASVAKLSYIYADEMLKAREVKHG